MMHMTFYWGTRVTILFDFWRTDSWLDYLLSLFACFLFSIFYQYMENRRLKLKKLQPQSTDGTSVQTPLLFSINSGGKWAPANFAGAMLFTINSAIGYFLMLAIMSFNWGVFIAVVVGLGFGHLLFRSGLEDAVVVVDNPCACA